MYSARNLAGRNKITWIVGAALLGGLLFAVGCGDDDDPTCPGAPSAVLLEFNFENFDLEQEIGSHSYTIAASDITGTWDTSNNGVQFFADSNVSVTRFFGIQAEQYVAPVLTFTTTVAKNIGHIQFAHWHNHNFFSTEVYNVKVQFDDGSGFVDLGTFIASSDTYGANESIPGPGQLAPGTYTIRWIPDGLGGGAENTNTDFFALDDVRLSTP